MKPPAFQFYPKDFLSDINVASMTMEERGVYITLLSYCWLEGCLKGGSQMLQVICNYPDKWDEIWAKVKQCFYENNGVFYHARLEKERIKQAEWREKSRRGGVESGKVRKLKGGSRVDEPKGNSSSSSSSSSPSSKKKEKKILKEKFGEFVSLTTEEYNKLIEKYGAEITKQMIEVLDNYKGSHGKTYKSDYRAILSWVVEKVLKEGASTKHAGILEWLKRTKKNNLNE